MAAAEDVVAEVDIERCSQLVTEFGVCVCMHTHYKRLKVKGLHIYIGLPPLIHCVSKRDPDIIDCNF